MTTTRRPEKIYKPGPHRTAENLTAEVDANGILTLTIDLKKKLRDARSGKSALVATTNGVTDLFLDDKTTGLVCPGSKVRMNLTLFVPKLED